MAARAAVSADSVTRRPARPSAQDGAECSVGHSPGFLPCDQAPVAEFVIADGSEAVLFLACAEHERIVEGLCADLGFSVIRAPE